MDPQLLRGGFRIGFFVAAVALVTLPFQPRGSAEFVVTILAAIIGGTLAGGIALLARSANPPLPGDRPGKDRNAQGGKSHDG